MQTIDIPRKDWLEALNSFSTRHEGWLVSVDLLGPELGAQPQVSDVPLRGITAETGPKHAAIMISTAHGDGEHFTHRIDSPSHVRLERGNDGADLALAVESAAGVTTIVRFTKPIATDRVDGIAARH